MSENDNDREELKRSAAAWEQAERDADLTVTLPGNVKLFARRIPATGPGGFWMGSRFGRSNEEPRHRVVIEQDYYLGTFPVTQEQYRAVVEASRDCELDARPSRFSESGHRRPVERVSFGDVATWCRLFSACGFARLERFDRPTMIRCCLPSEAEWERACRGGFDCEVEYAGRDRETGLSRVGWFRDNSRERTHPIGAKRPNAFGLFDMHGNVWEWCEDVWDVRAYRKRADGWKARAWTFADAGEDARELSDQSVDGVTARSAASARRVLRGGSWYDSSSWCRSAVRGGWWPNDRFWNQGFRVCLFPRPLCRQPVNQSPARRNEEAGALPD